MTYKPPKEMTVIVPVDLELQEFLVTCTGCPSEEGEGFEIDMIVHAGDCWDGKQVPSSSELFKRVEQELNSDIVNKKLNDAYTDDYEGYGDWAYQQWKERDL